MKHSCVESVLTIDLFFEVPYKYVMIRYSKLGLKVAMFMNRSQKIMQLMTMPLIVS